MAFHISLGRGLQVTADTAADVRALIGELGLAAAPRLLEAHAEAPPEIVIEPPAPRPPRRGKTKRRGAKTRRTSTRGQIVPVGTEVSGRDKTASPVRRPVARAAPAVERTGSDADAGVETELLQAIAAKTDGVSSSELNVRFRNAKARLKALAARNLVHLAGTGPRNFRWRIGAKSAGGGATNSTASRRTAKEGPQRPGPDDGVE